MKTILLLFALLNLAAAAFAQPHIVSIAGPFIEPGYPPYVVVSAQQLKNKTCTIEAATTPTFADAYTGAFYDCADESQPRAATFQSGPPWNYGFFRARNDPCNKNLSPEWNPPAFLLNPFEL